MAENKKKKTKTTKKTPAKKKRNSRKVKVKNTIPLTMEIIQGTIPNYYLNNGLNES